MWLKNSFHGQRPVLLKVTNICIHWNNAISVGSCIVLHITFLCKLRSAVEGMFPFSYHFQVAETFTLGKGA
jgi:hypothetical protein